MYIIKKKNQKLVISVSIDEEVLNKIKAKYKDINMSHLVNGLLKGFLEGKFNENE